MNDVPARSADDETDSLSGVNADAVRVAKGLGVAAVALSVPALAVAGAAALAALVMVVLAVPVLGGDRAVVGWIVLAPAVALLVVIAVFVLRVRSTLRAGRDRHALAADLIGLVDLRDITTATLADLAELTSRSGGLRAVSRARALWRILRRMDVGEHTAQFERAKWFVPPEVGATWALAQTVTWCGFVAWLMVPVVVGLRVSGTL